MAAVSLLGSTFTTTAGAKSVTASPAVGDLILIAVMVSGDSTWSAPTDNNSSGTYTRIDSQITTTFGPQGALYVRNSLIASGTSTIFSLANPGADTGGGLAVIKVTGMSLAGSSAVRQSKSASNGDPANTPATGNWTSSKLTSNAVVGFLIEEANPAGVTVTTGFTELLDTGYNTPSSGVQVQSINSGNTTNTMTWGSLVSGGWAVVGVELDASAASSSTGNMFLMF